MKDNYIRTSILSLALLSTITGCYKNEPIKKHKYSPLHTAVRLGQVDIVKSLATSSELNIKDSYGDTPLIDSIRNNTTEISKILICNGAETNTTDNNNYTLIDLATRNNNIEIINILTKIENKDFCNPEKKSENIKNIVINTKPNTVKTQPKVLVKEKLIKKEANKNIELPKEEIPSIKRNVNTIDKETSYDESLTTEELNHYISDEIESIENVNIQKTNFVSKPDISYSIKNDKTIHNNTDLVNKLNTISLDNSILFNSQKLTFVFSESSKLDDNFRNKLAIFIPQLMDAIESYKEEIKEIKVKSYTSSEFSSKRTIMDKFMANAKVSKRRATEINQYIITIANIFNLNAQWMEKNFVSYGMSSQNIIKDQYGNEDSIKSRRTELEIILK